MKGKLGADALELHEVAEHITEELLIKEGGQVLHAKKFVRTLREISHPSNYITHPRQQKMQGIQVKML